MALTIYEDIENATRIHSTGSSLRIDYIGNVDMGSFTTVHNTKEHTVLGTDGAGPCTIILIHVEAGVGALGHYAGHYDPGLVFAGVMKMIAKLEVAGVSEIAFSAGLIGDEPEQGEFERQIIEASQKICKKVSWRKPSSDVYGSCYYLPLSEQAGFSESSIRSGYFATGSAEVGIKQYSY